MHDIPLAWLLAGSLTAVARETTTEMILRTIPPAHGPVFTRAEEPLRTAEVLTRGFEELEWLSIIRPDRYASDSRDPKVIRQRFQDYVKRVRGREREFVPPGMVKPGKRPAARWGARSREQRTR